MYHFSIPVLWLKFNLIHLINRILETDQYIFTSSVFFLLNLQIMSDNIGLDWVGFIWLNADIWNTRVYLQQVALGFLVSQWRPSQLSLACFTLKHTCGVSEVNCALKMLIFFPFVVKTTKGKEQQTWEVWWDDHHSVMHVSLIYTSVTITFSLRQRLLVSCSRQTPQKYLSSCYLPLQYHLLFLPGGLK